jgi:hypothetical protein
VVANARQILDAAAAHEHDAVLLQVVALAADVRNDLEPFVRRTLATLRSAEFGFLGVVVLHAGADTATLRAALQGRRFGLDGLGRTTVANALVMVGIDGVSV